MRRAMAEAAVGDDVYGEDPTINELQEFAAELLGKEQALYLPSATMSNQVAVLSHTQRGDELFCDSSAHIYSSEAGSPAMLAGVMCHTLAHVDGVVSADELRAAIRPADIHHPRPRLFTLENTHTGAAIHPDRFRPTVEVAHEHGLSVHMDGARLFNAAVALGLPARSITEPVDSVTICLSKGLGAPMGAILAGSRDFISLARRYRKALGGGLRQAGIVAAGGLYALQHHVERLADDHRRASELARALSDIPGLRVLAPEVPTNMVVVQLPVAARPIIEAGRRAGVLFGAVGPDRLRLVTHLDVDDAGLAEAVGFFRELRFEQPSA